MTLNRNQKKNNVQGKEHDSERTKNVVEKDVYAVDNPSERLGEDNRNTTKTYIQRPTQTALYWCVCVIVLLIALLLGTENQKTDTVDENVIRTNSETTNVTGVDVSEISDEDFIAAVLDENVTGVYEEKGMLIDEVKYYTVERSKMQNITNCVGYIDIDDTYVSDWVVQANDNVYYLDVDVYGNAAENGAIFGDYRNDFDVLNLNNIIYAHNMADGTRFGTLQRLTKEDFYYNEQETYKPCDIAFDSMCYNNVFRVYSVYEIDLKTFNYIRTAFEDDQDFSAFIEQTRSYNAVAALKEEKIPANTKLLTLSTCTAGGAKRLVVHAYLYARETV